VGTGLKFGWKSRYDWTSQVFLMAVKEYIYTKRVEKLSMSLQNSRMFFFARSKPHFDSL
jgi:hypothetical protein